MRPPTKITAASLFECAALARIERAAFAPSPLFKRVWGNVLPDDYHAHSQGKLEAVFNAAEGKQRVFKAEQDGELVGFALWSVPRSSSAQAVGGAEARIKLEAAQHPKGYNAEEGTKYFGQPSSRPAYPNLGEFGTDQPSQPVAQAGCARALLAVKLLWSLTVPVRHEQV